MATNGYFMVTAATLTTVLVVVLLHYEVLSFLNRHLTHFSQKPRPRMLILILALFLTHVAEIWIFAGTFWLLGKDAGLGQLMYIDHPTAGNLLDYVYFSATVYTTVGFGDIIPGGHIRFLVGTEALAGLMLITWSASFTFLEMQRYWRG